jgi:hypothetical protein
MPRTEFWASSAEEHNIMVTNVAWCMAQRHTKFPFLLFLNNLLFLQSSYPALQTLIYGCGIYRCIILLLSLLYGMTIGGCRRVGVIRIGFGSRRDWRGRGRCRRSRSRWWRGSSSPCLGVLGRRTVHQRKGPLMQLAEVCRVRCQF